MILSCFRCSDNSGAGARYQDKKYGDGKRVHNERARSGTGATEYRCTVCEASRSAKAAL
jgi:hypothetical protein